MEVEDVESILPRSNKEEFLSKTNEVRNFKFKSISYFGDTTTSYGGANCGIWQLLDASNTIEVDNFRCKFTMWYEL